MTPGRWFFFGTIGAALLMQAKAGPGWIVTAGLLSGYLIDWRRPPDQD